MKTFLMMLGAILVSTPLLAAIGTEGHGGDPLRLLFNDARRYAVERVSQAKPCEFNVDVRPEVVEWIISHKTELAADIGAAPHMWTLAPQSSCAFTQTQPNSAVAMSFEACRPLIKDANDAISILAHESAHHLGIESEIFADEVGRAIARLGQSSTCNAAPSADPFDPGSCPGRQVSSDEMYSWLPLPHATQRELGKMKAIIRQRTCYGDNFCTNWQEDPSGLHARSEDGVRERRHATEGLVTVHLQRNVPIVIVESDPGTDHWIRWRTVGSVDASQTMSVFADSNAGPIYFNENVISGLHPYPTRLMGTLTPTCLRQVISTSHKTQDSARNTITIQKEMVILSHFE